MCFEIHNMESSAIHSEKELYRVVPFKGKREEWRKWSRKFLAHARYKGFKKILEGRIEYPEPEDDGSFSEEDLKEISKIEKMNHLAYNALIHLIDDDVSFNAVDTAYSDRFPDGCAETAWKKLLLRLEPSTLTTVFELEAEFSKSKLDDVNKNPEEWITELEYMKNKIIDLGGDFSINRLLGHILTNLPKEYDTTVEAIQREILLTSYTPTLEDTLVLLRTKYNMIKNRDENENKKQEETALVARGFKGRCRKCGVFGHKAVDCKKSTDSTKNNVECFYCKKKGHRIADCYKRKQKEEREKEKGGTDSAQCAEDKDKKEKKEKVLIATNEKYDKQDLWILDSGATMHMTNNDFGLYDEKTITSQVRIGDGTDLQVTKEGKKRMLVEQADGSSFEVVMEMKVVPKLCSNLFSMNRLISKGFQIRNQDLNIVLENGDMKLTFDRRVDSSSSSFLTCIKMTPILQESANVSKEKNSQKVKRIHAHQVLGHPHSHLVSQTAKSLGWNLVGPDATCANCATAKSKQQNVNKVSTASTATKKGERIMLDISSIDSKSFGGGKFWLLILDEFTKCKWTFILKSKDLLSDTVCTWIEEMQSKHSITIDKIRCDNAGENKSLQKDCKIRFPKIIFEFTAPHTPQQNGKVERAFATLYGRVRSMFNAAGLTGTLRQGLWAECARTATYLENILVYDKISSFEKFYGFCPKWTSTMRVFGEIAILYYGKKIRSKLEDRGYPAIFVGYCDDHSSNVFRFLNLKTHSLVLSRDYKWLQKMYGTYQQSPSEPMVYYFDDECFENDTLEQGGIEDVDVANDPSVEENNNEVPNEAPTDEPTQVPETRTGPVTRAQAREMRTNEESNQDPVRREVRLLRTFYNPNAGLLTREDFFEVDEFEFAMASLEVRTEPMKFKDAWDHPNESEKNLWREAIMKEITDMEQRGVWDVVDNSDVPRNRKPIGCRWVFELKRDGRHRARLVAQGFSQIPGVDFTDCFAPVVNDVTFRMLIVMMMVRNYECRMIDVETAFLHGDLDEEVYMRNPEGYDAGENKCLKLKKATYGLSQSARQWWKKLVKTMKGFKFKLSIAEPCLLFKRTEEGICLIVIYVDDCLVIGDKEEVRQAIENIKSVFKIKEKGTLDDYLGCEIKFDTSKIKAWLGQPHLIKKLEKTFAEETKHVKTNRTPGTPRFISIKPEEGDKISEKLQERFRSGIGMLLYLVKHSRPDISNSVRELSKRLDGANVAQYKEMLRVIKFVLASKDYGLYIHPTSQNLNEMWKIRAMSDSEFGGDPDTRISVGGWIIFFNDVPVLWCSRAMRSVTLSSTEAEYVAMSEVVKDIIFMRNILNSIGEDVEYPIIVEVDNTGAIYLGLNRSTGQRTKHIDIRYHYVREYIEDGVIKVVFVSTKQNDADMFTKNVTGDIYERTSTKLIISKEEII